MHSFLVFLLGVPVNGSTETFRPLADRCISKLERDPFESSDPKRRDPLYHT